ncbi:MAG: hypothetical protein WBD31_04235 [Rubripirellula sp.]
MLIDGVLAEITPVDERGGTVSLRLDTEKAHQVFTIDLRDGSRLLPRMTVTVRRNGTFALVTKNVFASPVESDISKFRVFLRGEVRKEDRLSLVVDGKPTDSKVVVRSRGLLSIANFEIEGGDFDATNCELILNDLRLPFLLTNR